MDTTARQLKAFNVQQLQYNKEFKTRKRLISVTS